MALRLFHLLPFTLTLASASPEATEWIDSPTLPGAAIPPATTLKIEADFENQGICSPTSLTQDSKGRIFIAETHRFGHGVEDARNHLDWYLDDLAATTTDDRRALYEKWQKQVPLTRMTEKSEVVRLLADTTGDGKLDQSSVFADGFNDLLDGAAAGLFSYEDTLYLGCIPNLLMLRDTNGDGRADERETIANGFGVRISLSGHDLSGFTLGPDGRIYGSIGDRGFNLTTREGVSLSHPNEGAVFRFEPDGSGFELFHTGLRNPKEVAFDNLGYPFTVDNNSDQGDAARVVYLVEGGDSGWEMEHQTMFSFHRQIGLEELPPSRWMNEKMWHLQTPEQPAYIVPPSAHLSSGPSGLSYHPGTGFLESESGRFLICDYRGSAANSAIWSFKMNPSGAGMKMVASRKLIKGIAASDVDFSWDGRLLIADFVGGWTSHDGGRLLSLDAGEQTWKARDAASTAKTMAAGFEQRSAAELLNLLKHPDSRIRLHAQLALTRKPEALKSFSDATISSIFQVRIHGIWGLGILARRGAALLPAAEFADIPSLKLRKDAEERLTALLDDKNEEIRCQALRALVDASDHSLPLPIGPLLADTSPRVRYFATLLAGKRRMIGYYGPICDMLAKNDNRDPLLRHAGAYALQHLAKDGNIIRALTNHPSAAVRLAAVVALRRMKNPDAAEFIRDADPSVADEAIRAICDLDLKSRRSAVATLLDQLDTRKWSPFMLRRLLHNSFRLGDAENAARVLKFASDPSQPEALRKEAFRLISLWLQPPPADQFTGHWRPLEPRGPEVLLPLLGTTVPALLQGDDLALIAALGLVANYQLEIPELDDKALRAIVTRAAIPDEARSRAIELLGTRQPAGMDDFLAEIIANSPPSVALTALRQLAASSPASAVAPVTAALDSGQSELVRAAWGILATVSGKAMDDLFVKHLTLLQAADGISPHALELIESARQRKSSPTVSAALAAFETSLAENPDPLARWNPVLQGGSPEAGLALFTSHPTGECMRCHRVGTGHETGADTAPNLSGIARRHSDRRYFLESLILPSATIAPGFGTVAVDFKNGGSLNGNLIDSTADHIDLESNGKTQRIPRSGIASMSAPVSAMPPMGDLLDASNLRDLIAWLASLDQEETQSTGATPTVPVEVIDPDQVPAPKSATTGIDAAILKAGRTQFIVCGACHGQNGEGTAAGPPLAGSEWVNGPAENLIRIQLRGLQGPITVKGQTYDFPAGMAALAYQSDDQIAAVLTYVRNSFGNSAPAVTPAEVAALRGEVGKPPLRAADLIPLPSSSPDVPEPTSDTKENPGKYDQLKSAPVFPWWAAVVVCAVAIAVLIPLFKRNI